MTGRADAAVTSRAVRFGSFVGALPLGPPGAMAVLAISGTIGFLLGAFVYPSWQDAVEPAQVVAGLVKYPAGNAFYIYETRLWTILHQLGAVALRLGISEITLSRILSGVLAMASLQALAMVTFALSRDAALSIGAAVLVFVTRAASNGVNYPVMLSATTHTYGSIGLSMFVLVPALMGAGSYRAGAFLLGLAPSIHPSMGAWLWPLAGLALVWDWRAFESHLRAIVTWFAIGAAITVLSLAIQFAFIYDGPAVESAVSTPYFRTFIAQWDGHRVPVDFGRPGVVLNQMALVVAVIWLTGYTGHTTRAAKVMLRFVLVAALGSLVLAAVTWVPQDRMPLWLLILMPGRVLNFNAMIFVSLLVGLAGAYRDRVAGAILLMSLAAGLLLTERSMLWEELAKLGYPARAAIGDQATLATGAFLTIVVGLWVWSRPAARASRLSAAMAVGVYAAIGLVFPVRLLSERPDPAAYFRDRTNDPFFAAIAAEPNGLVLTAGGYQLVQLYTRRPVLLCGALDTLAYAPESGPEMQRVLQDVYGVDLFNPPDAARGWGALPRETHRTLWENNSPERWSEIRRRWDVTQVLVPAAWTLQLPVAAETSAFRLYRIP